MMSGWMRLWVIVTLAGAAWSVWQGINSYREQALDADQIYMEAAAQALRRNDCTRQAPLPARHPPGAPDNCALFKLQALPEPLDLFTRHLAERRDLARFEALRDAALSALVSAVLISVGAGLLCFAVRWVAQGFRKN